MIRLYALHGGEQEDDKSTLTLHADLGKKILLPIQYFLVEHDRGRLLFDTGMNPAAVSFPEEYEPARLWGPRIREEDLAASRLESIGLKPEQIDIVANSHLHYDHAGGNLFFPSADFLIQFDELRGAMWPEPWERSNFYRPDFDLPVRWVELDSNYDIFGDGLVVLVQTPGHTMGSQSLIVKLPNTGSIILAQDAVYLNENIDDFKMPSMFWDMKAVSKSMRLLRELRRASNALLVPGHDWVFWQDVRKAPKFYD